MIYSRAAIGAPVRITVKTPGDDTVGISQAPAEPPDHQRPFFAGGSGAPARSSARKLAARSPGPARPLRHAATYSQLP